MAATERAALRIQHTTIWMGLLLGSLGIYGAQSGDAAQAASFQLAGAAAMGGVTCAMMTQAAANAKEDDQPLFMMLAMQQCTQAAQYASAQRKNERITEQLKMPDVQKNETPPPLKLDTPSEPDLSGVVKQQDDITRPVTASASGLDLNDLVQPLRLPEVASLDKGIAKQAMETTPAKAEEPPVEPATFPTSVPGLLGANAVTTDDTAKIPAALPASNSALLAAMGGTPLKGQPEATQDKSPAQFAAEAQGRKSGGDSGGGDATAAGASSGGDEKPASRDTSGDELLAKLMGAMDEKPPGADMGMVGGQMALEDAPKGQFENIFQFASYRYQKLVEGGKLKKPAPVKVARTP